MGPKATSIERITKESSDRIIAMQDQWIHCSRALSEVHHFLDVSAKLRFAHLKVAEIVASTFYILDVHKSGTDLP